MKLVYQIHNIGIYLDNNADPSWFSRIMDSLKIPLDGFEIYINKINIKYSIYIKDYNELNSSDYIVVPESSKFYEKEGIFITVENLNLGYMINDNHIDLWVSEDVTFVPYLAEVLFRKQNITFVHGASVVLNDKGILLLAFGGIGKTSFVSKAIKNDNVKLLGDDLILISSDGYLYSYPRPFCLYKYHRDLFPQFFINNKVKYVTVKNNMYFKRAIRKLKKILGIKDNNVYDYLTVSPFKLFNKSKIQIDPVKIEKVYVLRRKNGIDSVKVSNNITSEKASNFAHSVILHEWLTGVRYFLNEYAQKFENYLKPFYDKYNIINKCLSFAKMFYLVDIPNGMSAKKVCDELNKLIIGE